MKCGIYKAQNKINGLVYIGQSVNILKRWNNHKNDCMTGNSKFYKAIQEFGWDNFEWNIIEECPKEKLEEREKYWIDYYDSINNGYNTIYGSPFLRNNFKKITQEQYDNIIQDLIENIISIEDLSKKYDLSISYIYEINRGEDGNCKKELSFPLRPIISTHKNKKTISSIEEIYKDLKENILCFSDIAKKYCLGLSTIYKINNGEKYYNKNYSYPIRNLNSKKLLTKEEVSEIIYLLKNDKMSFDDIAIKYNRKIETIWEINNGSIYHIEGNNYPIRITNSIHFLTKEKVNEIKDKLKNTNITGLKLAEIYNVSKDAISDINTGKTWHDNNENYPIRNRKKKKN